MKPLLTLLLLLTTLVTAAQSRRPWEQLLVETLTAEDVESETWEDTYELLSDLEQQPLNLNTATRDDLLHLPFLSERQVEDIVGYLDRYGTMKSMNELRQSLR